VNPAIGTNLVLVIWCVLVVLAFGYVLLFA